MERAAAVLQETHDHLPENKRLDAARLLVLAIDTRSYTPELERHSLAVIAALADDAVERARYEFILGRALHATERVAEARALLQRAHNTMERNRARFAVDDRYECRARLGRAMLRSRLDVDAARAHLRAAWDARALLGARVALLAGVQHARALAASDRRGDRALAGGVWERVWAEHGRTAPPDDGRVTGFWATLVAAAGYYAKYLDGVGTPAALEMLRRVVERGRAVQQRLELSANRHLEDMYRKRFATGGPPTGAVPAPLRATKGRAPPGWFVH
jgi:hypothetical protein